MKKNPLLVLLAIFGAATVLVLVAIGGALYTAFSDRVPSLANNSVAIIDVKGIITDSRAFIKSIKKYREAKEVKAIVVRLDSPGGVVGPSQEIYDEILATKKEGKPIVCSLGSVAASGAYYIAAGCDKIVTNPGTITGSIGVIMEFANISKLYEWAKINRYVVKSGQYKDIGSEFRTMTPAEKDIIQGMIDSVHMQFKTAVATGRKMKMEAVTQIADGRIFSGEQAVKKGLADSMGGLEEAVNVAAKLAGIKGEPEIYYPPTKKKRLIDLFLDREDEDEAVFGAIKKTLALELIGKPLYLLPLSRF
ncbi:MAG: signal peptide peptidase SppA [Oligoflexia bacterium]|nr:signal peptide peptidase SppA [Oligoflexia bacterium]